MNRTFNYIILLLILSLLFSCKSKEKVVKKNLPHRSTNTLLEELGKNEFDFNTISAKASIEFDNGKKTSFKSHIRIRKDSAIWVSITPLFGIEMARVLITTDSVKVIDRVHSTYFVGDMDYINNAFKVDLDFNMLQSLLIGNSIEFEKNNKVRSSIDKKNNSYYISTVKKRKLKKEIKKEKEKIKQQAQIIWLNPESFKVTSLLLKDPETEQSLVGTYENHKALNEQLFPYNIRFSLESKGS